MQVKDKVVQQDSLIGNMNLLIGRLEGRLDRQSDAATRVEEHLEEVQLLANDVQGKVTSLDLDAASAIITAMRDSALHLEQKLTNYSMKVDEIGNVKLALD